MRGAEQGEVAHGRGSPVWAGERSRSGAWAAGAWAGACAAACATAGACVTAGGWPVRSSERSGRLGPGSTPPAASNSLVGRRIPYRRCTACLVTPRAEPTESQEKPSARSNSTAAATSVSTLSRNSWARRTVGAGARPYTTKPAEVLGRRGR
ncbi:hypothetical protein GCM10009639_45630 [Kitasatospora putterlickiae]|uniref:Uncharacterized protein n=1 Tax=Kitasatospora putterlickiae TaxID=221725 RepID=A0ABN1YC47_9ACTN